MDRLERRSHLIGVTFDHPIRSVLCVGAHADDIEIGAAGLISHIASQYEDAEFTFVVLSGDVDRQSEAEASLAGLLGRRGKLMMSLSADNLLPYEDPVGVKQFLRSALSPESPEIVIAPRLKDRHQDHAFAARLVNQVFRDHLVLSYEIAKYDGDLGRPQLFLPLSHEEVDAKVEHLLGHFKSQHVKPWYSADAFRALMRLRGIECNSSSGMAEAFHVSKLQLGPVSPCHVPRR